MKAYPEFYIKGTEGYFNTNLSDNQGNKVVGFSYRRAVQTWKSEKAAAKWLNIAKTLDNNAVIVNNTVYK